jgi:hypothetical protein
MHKGKKENGKLFGAGRESALECIAGKLQLSWIYETSLPIEGDGNIE